MVPVQKYILIIILALILFAYPLWAQSNSTSTLLQNVYSWNVPDSLHKQTQKSPIHNPKKAIWLSAAIPGAGQIYNKKYWKVPIVLGGLGTCIYFVRSNNISYQDYRKALLQRNDPLQINPDKYADVYSTDQLLTLQDQFHQNRDMFIMVTALVYALNIVDALVDAHLYTFDVSDDLSLQWQPVYAPSFENKYTAGLKLSLKFK